MEWTYISGWAFVAVLALPLGLIAFVARTWTVGTVAVGQESVDIDRMQIAGIDKKATAKAVNAVID